MNVKQFIILAKIEAISLLALFFIAMPLKYLAGMPEFVRVVGMAHGLLFIAYILAAFYLSDKQNWPLKKLIFICAISSIPFGPFLFEKKLLGSQN